MVRMYVQSVRFKDSQGGIMMLLRRQANNGRETPQAAEAYEFTDSSLIPPLQHQHHVCRIAIKTVPGAHCTAVDMYSMFTIPQSHTANSQSHIYRCAPMDQFEQDHRRYKARRGAKYGPNACKI